MQNDKLNAVKEAIRNGCMVESAGGISITATQSDKLGFDWRIYSVNDVIVRKDYVEQDNPAGTSADNPIEYEDDVPLINNAYYHKDNGIYVWMGGMGRMEERIKRRYNCGLFGKRRLRTTYYQHKRQS